MGIFSDLDANDVFGSTGSGGGTAGTGTNPNNISWTDKIFSTATDFGTQYLDILGRGELQKKAFDYAAVNQARTLNTVEAPQNIGAAPAQTYLPTSSGSGGSGMPSQSTLLIGAALLAAVVLLK